MTRKSSGHGFGTAPVFLAAISTILGAILFLRFGYAVAHVGLFGAFLIILIGHAITIPTAMAIAEISTNLKVEGGGEYFIISRSFGSMVGGTIGISLYFSQAISIAFYMIAFAEAFTPAFGWFEGLTGIEPQTWMISIPATVLLLVLMITRGAELGVTVLWVVVTTLALSLFMFFIGSSSSSSGSTGLDIFAKVQNPDKFFVVFAIIFPAFTGMTAGVGLSGDLKNPRKSIPLGTLSATLAGMVIYFFVVIKMAYSLSPEELAADQFAMSKIAVWGPIIPIGLAAASISSAIGSILIAPRTLQALGSDQVFPSATVSKFLAKGRGEANEPMNATLFTAGIVFAVVALGNVNFVAQIISMFFMITYGFLCLVSFLEHFAGNPSYRPTFRSKWYLSLIGALACFIMMFQMAPVYAFLSLIAIVVIYLSLKRGREEEDDLSAMIKGVLFQLTRRLQVLIQRKQAAVALSNWRPSFIAISSSSFTRLAPFDLLRWISHYYGFGTFIHYIKGPLDESTQRESKEKLDRLIKQGAVSHAGIYVDTIISPSFKTAVAQIVQIPGISGLENNSMLFEFHEDDEGEISRIIDGCQFASIVDFNQCVLRSSERHFGYKQRIDIWLTPGDYRNANLMILLAYIIMGHPEWKGCEIEIFAAFEKAEMSKQVGRLNQLIEQGRIPISQNKVQRMPWNKRAKSYQSLVCENSEDADLVIMGFSLNKVTQEKGEFFKRFKNIKEILFVRAGQKIVISEG
ncbi:amino acid permease [candidate division KSB1 bacterium]|nr:amino acid permease [candidate division KSB1 bacterium]